MFTLEQHHSVTYYAKLWGLSAATISELFRNEPGVLLIDRPESRNKRGYRSMRIPESVAKRVHDRLSRGKNAWSGY